MVGEHLEDGLGRRRDLAREGEAGHRREGYRRPGALSQLQRCGIGPLDRARPRRAIARWSRQERTICRTQALTGVLTFSAPTISATISKAVRSPSASALAHLAEQLVDLAPRLGDLGLGVAEGAAVAGQAEVDLERLDLVEAARGIRRPGRGCGRGRRRGRCGRAGGRRRSAACARAGAGRRARARGRASRGPARCRGRSRPRPRAARSRSGSTIASIPVSSSSLRDSR